MEKILSHIKKKKDLLSSCVSSSYLITSAKIFKNKFTYHVYLNFEVSLFNSVYFTLCPPKVDICHHTEYIHLILKSSIPELTQNFI